MFFNVFFSECFFLSTFVIDVSHLPQPRGKYKHPGSIIFCSSFCIFFTSQNGNILCFFLGCSLFEVHDVFPPLTPALQAVAEPPRAGDVQRSGLAAIARVADAPRLHTVEVRLARNEVGDGGALALASLKHACNLRTQAWELVPGTDTYMHNTYAQRAHIYICT